VIGWSKTLRGRTIAMVAIGALVSHVLALAVYFTFNASSLSTAREQQVVERLATTAKLMERLPRGNRADVVADLSEPDFRLAHASTSRVAMADSGEEDTRFVRRTLALALGVPTEDFVFADYELSESAEERAKADLPPTILAARAARWFRFREDLFISLQLADGDWLNAQVSGRPLANFLNHGVMWSIGLIVLAVAFLSALAVARPLAGLKRFAQAAESLGMDVEKARPLSEHGPLEISRTARAFNRMQDRIRTLVEDRTRMLAAMSHDFRTPLTRLRLRAEFLGNAEDRRKMLRDIADMEAMVASTLRFISDGKTDELHEPTDFVSLLTELCLDMEIEPPQFRLQGARLVRVLCAPVAMRRAFTNLLENAKAHATQISVRVGCQGDKVVVDIIDNGPGIPESDYENVFKPYYRLDVSRSRQTGGSGLGLSIARAVLNAHGGSISLHPVHGGGLRVETCIPLA
jgi:signal transduction histidine kinase